MAQHIVYFIAGLTDSRVDRANGVIKGVSVITGGVQAKGHELWTDQVTLEQMAERGKKMGKVLVKENHRKGGESTGVDAGVGWLQNFRVEGEHTRADLYLYPSHGKRDLYLDIAEKTPELMGLSAAFLPPEKPVVVDGKKRARVEELVTVDIVTQPAANPGGWFEAGPLWPGARVDKSASAMADQNPPANTPGKEPSLTDLLNAINGLTEKVGSFEQRLGEIEAAAQPAPTAEELDELEGMSDADLQKLGITREDIAQARAEIAEIAKNDPANTDANAPKPGAAAPAAGTNAPAPGAPAAAAAPAGAALEAALKRLTALERRIQAEDAAKAQAEVETEFAAIEQQIKELEAENKALKTLNEAAGKAPLKNGRDVVGFELSAGGHKPGTFEHFVELELKEPEHKGDRTLAMLAAVKKHPTEHRQYLERLGVEKPRA